MTRMQTVMAVILIGLGRWYQYSSKTKLTVSPQLHVYCSDLTIFQFCERRIWISDTCTSQKLSIRCSNHVMGDPLEVNASENRAYSPIIGSTGREYADGTVDYLIVHTVGLGKLSCILGGMQEAHVTHGVTKVTNM